MNWMLPLLYESILLLAVEWLVLQRVCIAQLAKLNINTDLNKLWISFEREK